MYISLVPKLYPRTCNEKRGCKWSEYEGKAWERGYMYTCTDQLFLKLTPPTIYLFSISHTHTHTHTQRSIKHSMYITLAVNPTLAFLALVFSFLPTSVVSLTFFYGIGSATAVVRLALLLYHSKFSHWNRVA